MIGYADVQVTLTDINDNAPYFEGGMQFFLTPFRKIIVFLIIGPHKGYVEEGQSSK